MKFSGAITTDNGDVHAKGRSQRLKVNVTKVKTSCALICAIPDRNSSLNSQMARE